MSRIQEILAKAERDGTARRTQAGPTPAPAPHPISVAPAIDGSSALDPVEMMHSSAAAPLAEAHDFVETLPMAPAVEARSAHIDLAPPSFENRATNAAPSFEARAASMAPSFDARAATAPRVATAEPNTARAVLHRALVAAIEPHSAVAEQYRSIRTRLTAREEVAPLRTIMVTSPGSREGKSITAANLALTMAQEIHRRIVIVDCDLRGSSVHSLFGLEPSVGLAEVLAGEASLDEALIHLPELRLTVLPAGGAPQFPTELLGSTLMRRTLDSLRSRFDRIVLDVPAVMPLADAGTVAPMADGILMVVRAGHTQRPVLDHAIAAFEQSKLVGVVLNDAN
jgi:capsular exopolysaccharide synthesis family protein